MTVASAPVRESGSLPATTILRDGLLPAVLSLPPALSVLPATGLLPVSPLPLPLPLPLPPLLPPASAVTALAMFFVAVSVALMVAFLSDTVFSAAASVFLNAATRPAE